MKSNKVKVHGYRFVITPDGRSPLSRSHFRDSPHVSMSILIPPRVQPACPSPPGHNPLSNPHLTLSPHEPRARPNLRKPRLCV